MDVGQVLAEDLALPSSYVTSFPLMVWATRPVLVQVVRRENADSCGQLWGLGFCSLQDSRAMGLPRALHAVQSITSHHEPI